MLVHRTLHVDDFRKMCADQLEEKAARLAAGGKICDTCKGTGTHEGKKSTTLFGCRDCNGIGARS